ncbi:MAG TPA: FG-GAP-like repeat-containing protein [Acidobacteriota bacterium]|nr:FG-GAP-like repeat-containing protein [Acidobacteriota bacterium]
MMIAVANDSQTGHSRKPLRRALKWTLGGLLLLTAGAALWLWVGYPGFTEMVIADLRYATWRENRSQYGFLFYYADFLGRLRFDGPMAVIPPPQPSDSPFEQGQLHFHRGDFAAAVQAFRQAIDAQGENQERLFWLASALMRQAEAENCLPLLQSPGQEPTGGGSEASRGLPANDENASPSVAPQAQLARGQQASPPLQHLHSQDVCTLPIRFPHRRPQSMRSAAAALEKLLDDYSSQDPLYLWLLNFAYMAQGTWPQEVPARYLLRSDFTELFYGQTRSRIRERFGWLRLRDRGRELGVALADAGKGVAVEDFDGDGDLDIVTGGSYGRLHFFRNRDGDGFTDASDEAGLSGVLQPFIITAADYDGDGAMDLFVSCPLTHFRLLRNNGRGVFSDVTFSSGLLKENEAETLRINTFASAWSDVDNDGDLDLFVAQFGGQMPFTKGLYATRFMPSRLYINESGHFSDRTSDFGLSRLLDDRIFFGAAFGDYDGDGWQDLFLSSYGRGVSMLLRNQSGNGFVDSGLVHPRETGFMAAFLDIDHDGRLDLFQGGQSPAGTAAADSVLRKRPWRNTSRIFLQSASGFDERKDLFSPPISAGTMGSNFGDLNNDGCYDFYLGTGNPESWYVLPNLMYVGLSEDGRCSGRMDNVSMLEGLGTIQKGHGIVFFDFDGDGDQDIYSSLGGMWQGDIWPNQLLVNESEVSNAWVKIRLRGRRSNRWGLGSIITIDAENESGRPIRRTYLMDNGTGFGSTPYLAHIGLLDAARVLRTTVTWPASGCSAHYQVELRTLNWLDEAACPQAKQGQKERGARERPNR